MPGSRRLCFHQSRSSNNRCCPATDSEAISPLRSLSYAAGPGKPKSRGTPAASPQRGHCSWVIGPGLQLKRCEKSESPHVGAARACRRAPRWGLSRACPSDRASPFGLHPTAATRLAKHPTWLGRSSGCPALRLSTLPRLPSPCRLLLGKLEMAAGWTRRRL